MPFDDREREPRRDPEALLRQAQATERALASRATEDLSRLRLGRRQVVSPVRRGPAPPRARTGRRRRRHAGRWRGRTRPEFARGLEVVPTLDVDGVPVIDTPALLARRPHVCLVDGLAYDHPPGCRHAKRYEDVEELLDAGISVLTSINLEYIAEEAAVRSKRRRPRPPSRRCRATFINRADEVVVVDAPTETRDVARGRATVPAPPARAAAHGRRRRSPARKLSAGAAASSCRGARRSAFSCA